MKLLASFQKISCFRCIHQHNDFQLTNSFFAVSYPEENLCISIFSKRNLRFLTLGICVYIRWKVLFRNTGIYNSATGYVGFLFIKLLLKRRFFWNIYVHIPKLEEASILYNHIWRTPKNNGEILSNAILKCFLWMNECYRSKS